MHLVGLDPLHVDQSLGQPAGLAAAAEDVDLEVRRRGRGLAVLGVGDDPPGAPELGLTRGVAVRSHQHRHRADPVQRRDDRQRARAGLHQDPDVLALPDADLEQPADHVVDPLLDREVGVGTVFEEQHDVVGSRLRLLVEQQPERDPGSRVDPAEPVELVELSRRAADDLADRAAGAEGGPGERLHGSDPGADRQLGAGADPIAGAEPVLRPLRDLLDPLDAVRELAVAVPPAGPGGDGRPGGLDRGRTDDEAEMAGRQADLVDGGAGRRPARRTDRARRGDLVVLAHEREDRAGHVGQRHQPVLDHEAARDQAVVDAELADHVGERRAGPGDPPVGLEEAPLTLPGQQGLAVVELADEGQPLAQRLRRIEHPEAGAAHPGGHAGGGEDVLGEERGRADRRILGKPEAERAAGVDGAAEDDDRVDPP